MYLLPNIYSIEQIGAVASINAFDVYISMYVHLCSYVNLHTPFKHMIHLTLMNDQEYTIIIIYSRYDAVPELLYMDFPL